jgi:hypothetical protein
MAARLVLSTVYDHDIPEMRHVFEPTLLQRASVSPRAT